MFFSVADGLHPTPLTHNPLNALVMPRPIAWVSSISATGIANLAPYSYFNLVSSDPPYLMFAPNAGRPGTAKDTYHNICVVPEFVVNLVGAHDLIDMNASSASLAPEIDEFHACGIATAPAQLVRPPRVASALASLECRVYQCLDLPASADGRVSHVVIGQIVGIHIADAVIVDGQVDERRLHPITRLGYMNYGTLGDLFELQRP